MLIDWKKSIKMQKLVQNQNGTRENNDLVKIKEPNLNLDTVPSMFMGQKQSVKMQKVIENQTSTGESNDLTKNWRGDC